MEGKLDGTALRVPTPNVSAVDLTFEPAKSVTVEDVNAAVAAACSGHMGMVMSYDPEPKFRLISTTRHNHPSLRPIKPKVVDAPCAECWRGMTTNGIFGAHGRRGRTYGPMI
jgi:glyceraldehyde 3-phosphate dehydrogenase